MLGFIVVFFFQCKLRLYEMDWLLLYFFLSRVYDLDMTLCMCVFVCGCLRTNPVLCRKRMKNEDITVNIIYNLCCFILSLQITILLLFFSFFFFFFIFYLDFLCSPSLSLYICCSPRLPMQTGDIQLLSEQECKGMTIKTFFILHTAC